MYDSALVIHHSQAELCGIESQDSEGNPNGASNLDETNAGTQPGWTKGANNITNGGAVSPDELPAETISGTLDPRVGTVTITKSSDWGTGFQGDGVIINDTSKTIGSWSITFEADFTIDQIWNADIVSHEGTTYVLNSRDRSARSGLIWTW